MKMWSVMEAEKASDSALKTHTFVSLMRKNLYKFTDSRYREIVKNNSGFDYFFIIWIETYWKLLWICKRENFCAKKCYSNIKMI